MLARLLRVLRLLTVLAGGHRVLALENVALRQQLALYRRTRPRPSVRWSDRLFWYWTWRSGPPALVGEAVRVVTSSGTNRMLSAPLVDVPFWDPLTLSAAGIVLLLAALAGCALPARRAMRIAPLAALRLD